MTTSNPAMKPDYSTALRASVDQLIAERDRLAAELDKANGLLRKNMALLYGYSQTFGARNFTDRYGDAQRCQDAADAIRAHLEGRI